MTPTGSGHGRFVVETGEIADGRADRWFALAEGLPEFVGRGEDEDEAIEDLVEQVTLALSWPLLH